MVKEQTGLWIDRAVLFSNLTVFEKMILADILVLSNSSSVYLKANDTIAKTLNISSRTVRRVMASLLSKELIRYEISRPYGTVKVKRIIYPCYNAIKKYTKDNCSNC